MADVILDGGQEEKHALGSVAQFGKSECQECGGTRPTRVDPDDGQHYCQLCWSAFYARTPHAASSSLTAGARAAPGARDATSGALPEDAPRGHAAHRAVKRNNHQNPYVTFQWRGQDRLIPFQVTVAAAGGSLHSAEVIARACYLKFEQGWTKDRVLAFRSSCYARLRRGGPSVADLEQPRASKSVRAAVATAPPLPSGETSPERPAAQARSAAALPAVVSSARAATGEQPSAQRATAEQPPANAAMGEQPVVQRCLRSEVSDGSVREAKEVAAGGEADSGQDNELDVGSKNEVPFDGRDAARKHSCVTPPRRAEHGEDRNWQCSSSGKHDETFVRARAIAAVASRVSPSGLAAGEPMQPCQECGESKPLHRDAKDGQHYCRECWTEFYGHPPPSVVTDSQSPSHIRKFQMLPDDAPRGHAAHRAVRRSSAKGVVSFQWMGPEGCTHFQATVTAAGGSWEAAEVIVRACYMRFEQGWTKEHVLSFRNSCYARVNSHEPGGSDAAKPADELPEVSTVSTLAPAKIVRAVAPATAPLASRLLQDATPRGDPPISAATSLPPPLYGPIPSDAELQATPAVLATHLIQANQAAHVQPREQRSASTALFLEDSTRDGSNEEVSEARRNDVADQPAAFTNVEIAKRVDAVSAQKVDRVEIENSVGEGEVAELNPNIACGDPSNLPSKQHASKSCFECDKRCRTYLDRQDNHEYCYDCWLACYGEPPRPITTTMGSSGTRRVDARGVSDIPSGMLPDDAPSGHAAHIAVGCRSGDSNPRCGFKFKANGQSIAFQTTVAAAGGSRHAAEVIARACYMKFEQGWSKDAVLAFRNECYARVTHAGFDAARSAKIATATDIESEPLRKQARREENKHKPFSETCEDVGDGLAEPDLARRAGETESKCHITNVHGTGRDVPVTHWLADEAHGAEQSRVRRCQQCGEEKPTTRDAGDDDQYYCAQCWVSFYGRYSPAAAQLPASDAAGGTVLPAAEALPQDAPQGHAAFTAARCSSTHANPYVSFKFKCSDNAVPFQTTVAACGGSRFAAEVIARACYVRFEQGWSKERVLEFRNECYARLRQAHAGVDGTKSSKFGSAASAPAIKSSFAPAMQLPVCAAPPPKRARTAPVPALALPRAQPQLVVQATSSCAVARDLSVNAGATAPPSSPPPAWLPVEFLLSLLDDPSAPLPFATWASMPVQPDLTAATGVASLQLVSSGCAVQAAINEPFVMEEAWAREMGQLAGQIEQCEGRLEQARHRLSELDGLASAGRQVQMTALSEELSALAGDAAERRSARKAHADQLRAKISEHHEALARLAKELEDAESQDRRADDADSEAQQDVERRMQETKELAVTPEHRAAKASWLALQDERERLLAARSELASWKCGPT